MYPTTTRATDRPGTSSRTAVGAVARYPPLSLGRDDAGSAADCGWLRGTTQSMKVKDVDAHRRLPALWKSRRYLLVIRTMFGSGPHGP